MILYSYKNIWDKIGIGASLLCAIHCVALPIFFTTLPLMGIELIENKWVEVISIATSLCIGGWAIVNSYCKYHHNKYLLAAFIIGIAFLVIGNIIENESVEIVSKLIAAIILVTVHIVNWKKSKQCSLCNTHV